MLDPDIRQALIPAIRPEFGDGLLLSEVGLWGNSVRIDLARLTPFAMDGFEIKSHSDSLSRLRVQAAVYGLICDSLTLVAASKHIEKAAALLPAWWGLAEVLPSAGGVSISCVRSAGANPAQDSVRIAGLLWRDEAIEELRFNGKERGLSKLRAEEAYGLLAGSASLETLKMRVYARLARREDWLNRHNPLFVGPFAPRV